MTESEIREALAKAAVTSHTLECSRCERRIKSHSLELLAHEGHDWSWTVDEEGRPICGEHNCCKCGADLPDKCEACRQVLAPNFGVGVPR